MGNTTRYAAVNTKIRTLEGRLLKTEDYLNLLSKKSVPEIALYLKQRTHYMDILDGIDENEIHRGRLESLLKESHINGLNKIVHYFYDVYKDFFMTLFIRYEIEDLKIVIRAVKTGRVDEIDRDSLVHLGVYSLIDKERILTSKNGPDFVKNLKGTVYYDYLKMFLNSGDDISLFRIEMALDLAYFDLFYKSSCKMNKRDRKIVEHIQGINVDLLNLQWIYRGIKFYGLSPEELFNYTIAYGEEFNRGYIKELCYSKSIEEFQKKVLGTRYGFLFDHNRTKDIFMERRILRYQHYRVIMALRKDVGMNISQAIAYVLLLEDEVRDIISIIESIRYGMAMEEAKKFLIREL